MDPKNKIQGKKIINQGRKREDWYLKYVYVKYNPK